MARLLQRWGHLCARHARLVLTLWLAGALLVVVTVSQLGAQTDNDLNLPGTDSQRAFDLLAEQFPPQQNGTSPLVFHVDTGKLSDTSNQKAVQAAVAAVAKRPHVASATDPFANAQAGLVSQDGRTAFSPVLLDEGSGELDETTAQDVLDAATVATSAGVEVTVGGPIGGELSQPATESSELVGLLAAMLILTLTFGSVMAMGMPIVSAVIGLAVGIGTIGLLGHLVTIPSVGPTLATMIGLGVGIDYALFLVSRHREQLADGVPVHESVARTVGTAGNAVVFAGGTVVVAMLALAVSGIPFLTSLGVACAVAVLTAVLAAISLLPALLAVVGTRVNALSLPRVLRPRARPAGHSAWEAWGRAVTRRPWIFGTAALLALLVLVVPTLSLTLGQEDIGVTPTSATERQAFDRMAAGFGPGYNGPLVVVNALDPVAAPSAEYTKQYDQAMSMKADLEQKQKMLTAEADELTADKAALQQQQSALETQSAELRQQQAALEARKAGLQRKERALEKQQRVLERRKRALQKNQRALEKQQRTLQSERAALERQARALAADVRGSLRTLRAQERERVALAAEIRAVQDALARDPGPVVTDELEQRLSSLQTRQAALLEDIAATRAALTADRADARRLAREARSLARQAQKLAAQADRLQRQADELQRQATALSRRAATLTRQADSLRRQANALQAQGAALQRQATELQQQADDLQDRADALQQQQADAKAEQQQAEALQDQLTDELTKAGGDDRGTDPRLVAEQDALTGIGTKGGVQVVGPPRINTSGSAAYFSVVPTTRPADPATATLVGELRDTVLPPISAQQGLVAYVGGTTASNVDLAALISSRLLLVILTVVGLSFVLLTIAFRSLLIPLQAAVTNLVSVAAAFGVLTACFQWGWGLGLIGLDSPYGTVPIASYVPLMMFAALFGLSMDYEVFLVSQIQHAHLRGDEPSAAVRHGIASSGKVIVAAALIMIAVFGSFVLNGDPIVKQFGVGLSVAVLLAAVMVLVFAPALITVFGHRAFWLPRFLDRVVPHVDVEGTEASDVRETGVRKPSVATPTASARTAEVAGDRDA